MSEETVATTEEAPAPDISEQMTDLSARFDKFLESQSEPEPAPADPASLYPTFDEEPEQEFDATQWAEPDPFTAPADPRLDAVEEYIVEREQRETTQRLQSLGEKYPALKDPQMVDQVRARISDIGIDPASVRDYPAMVEAVYKSIAAEADADAETPAEEARSRGARLETDASGSAPSEEDPDAEFKHELRALTSNKDIFS